MNITNLQTAIRRILYIVLATIDTLLGRSKPLVTILCYHGIDNSGWYHSVSLTEFEKQITALAKNYRFISLAEVLEYIEGNKIITAPSICITFDDGYQSILYVQKLLKKFSITPTVFVLTDPENVNRSELENELQLLTEKEIKELQKAGWEIGSHTATHPNLKTLNKMQLKKEITTSKNAIEKITGVECQYIAYPKGKYSNKALEIVEKSNYVMGLSMDDDIITSNSPVLTVPRIGVNGSHSVTELLAALSPLSTQFRKSIKRIIN